LKIETAEKMY